MSTPMARSSSTTSSIVPSTEPSATTTVSASPARIRAHQAPGGPPELLLELAGDPRDEVERLHLLCVHEVLDLGERLGADHRADRHRIVRVEHLSRLEGGQERVHLSLRGEVDGLDRVREDEPVHAHHHRQRELLGERERLHVEVATASWFDSAKTGSSRAVVALATILSHPSGRSQRC